MKNKMKLTKTNKVIFAIVILFFICSAIFLSGLITKGKKVLAETSTEQYDYTDSDYLTKGSSYTIRDYADRLIGTQAHVQYTDGKYQIVYPEHDDPIVSIIPKNLFHTECSELVIGKEYGYYINTSLAGMNYNSTVMVFDIVIDTDLELTTDRVFITLKPLFEYKYVCVLGEDSYVFMDRNQVEYSASSYCVVPYATISGSSIEYLESTQYYLKDVSFAGTLYNEQHLNLGDLLYDANKDYGSYFTAFDYEYSGKYRKNSAFAADNAAKMMLSAVKIGISIGRSKETAGLAKKALGVIFDIDSIGADFINFYDSLTNWLNGELVQTEKTVTTSCLYQNRSDQLSHYKDSLGRPALAKIAGLTCNTSEDESLWYGVGDYARAIFYVSHGGSEGITPYYTRLVDNIGLKVVDSTTDKVVKSEIGLGSASLRSPEYKTVLIDGTSDVYMLPEGQDNFTFNPQYESDYEIVIELSDEADIYINGKKNRGKNIAVKQHALANKGITISLSGNTVGLNGTIKISPNLENTIAQISAKQDYILKTTLSGVRKLKTNNADLEIKEFFKLKNGILSDYREYGEITPCDEISYPFNSDTYYVLIQNKSNEDMVAQSFSDEEVELLSIGSENIVDLSSSNLNYFRITASSSVNHVISLPDTKGKDFSYVILNPDLSSGSGRSYINGMYIVGLEANETFYFGVKTGSDENNASILIDKTEKGFQWKISGGDFGTDGKILSQNNVSVKRGVKYTLSFLINGKDSKAGLLSVDSNTSWGKYGFSVNSDTNTISVPYNCPIGGDGITVKAWDSVEQDTSYNHTLRVVPTDTLGIDYTQVINSDDVILSVETPRFVSKVIYQLSYGNVSETGTITIEGEAVNNNFNNKEVSILSKIQGIVYDTPAYVDLKIIKVYYYDAYKNEKINSNNQYVASINNLFDEGEGTADLPYIIRCGRHLDNIRKSQSSYFYLVNDVSCPSDWNPIARFDGVLDMGGSCITLDNTSIGLDENYGFIDQNYGTVSNGSFLPKMTTVTGKGKSCFIGVVAAVNYGTIEKCTTLHDNGTDIYIKCWYFYFGGIVGCNKGTISECENYATIRGNCVNFGGISGSTTGDGNKIYKCSNYGKIYGEADGTISACFGGIVGIAAEGSKVEQPYNEGDLLFDYKKTDQNVSVYIGQIAGRMCKADKLVNAKCNGTAKIKDGVYVYQSYLTDDAVGMYFDPAKPSGGSCLAEGTLITLADGSQVPVESLTGDEKLLVWNLYTGKFDTAPILFIDHEDSTKYNVINLSFSDGTQVKVIYEHAFWDFNLNRYVFLREDANQYIGHWFNKQSTDEKGNMNWIKVQLVDVNIAEEYTSAWSPVTYGHLCIYVNGMLSMPGATEGFINIFDVDEDVMQINQEKYLSDIETYGLLTYDEFAEKYDVPETIFEAFGGKYLNISFGKGLINESMLIELIERYSKFFV